MPEAFNERELAAESSPVAGQSKMRKRRLAPPIWVWTLVVGSLAMIGGIRAGNLTGDHAHDNVLTLVLGFVAVNGVVGWFVFWSGYPRALRTLTAAAVVGGIALTLGLFEIHHVSGELVPVFRARWHGAPDEFLPKVKPLQGSAVDLSTTTDIDFPQFLGPNRTANIEGIRLERDWEEHPPRLLWRQPVGAGWSAFSAVNGFAVTMEQRGREELVTCYEIATGQLCWSQGTDTRHSTRLGGTGPRSTPTIVDGKVYTLGATGNVLCLDGSNGEILWSDNILRRYDLDPQQDLRGVAWGRSASLLVVDDRLVVPAGGPPGGPYVSLIAFDKNNGEVVWEAGERQVSFSSPVVDTLAGLSQIVSVNQDYVSGHRIRSGQVLWEHSWPGSSAADANASQARVLPGDRLFLSKGYGRGAALFQIHATSKGAPLRLREIWHKPRVLKTKFTNVVVQNGYLYGLSDGILECVRLADGERQWKRGRYGHGQLLGVTDVLLVQAESGQVFMVDATPTRFDELGRLNALTGKTWNNLCLYGTRLLVRNSEQAACYELPGEVGNKQ